MIGQLEAYRLPRRNNRPAPHRPRVGGSMIGKLEANRLAKPLEGATGAETRLDADRADVLPFLDNPFPVAPNGAFLPFCSSIPGAHAPGYNLSPATRAAPLWREITQAAFNLVPFDPVSVEA